MSTYYLASETGFLIENDQYKPTIAGSDDVDKRIALYSN